jgi:hypothetical protein
MFRRKPDPRVLELDTEISRVLANMSDTDPFDEKYANMTTEWTKLNTEREKLLSNRFSKDQILLVGGNIFIAALVIGYERGAVITTKLPSFLSKASR